MSDRPMPEDLPTFGSTEALFIAKRQEYICEDRGYHWPSQPETTTLEEP